MYGEDHNVSIGCIHFVNFHHPRQISLPLPFLCHIMAAEDETKSKTAAATEATTTEPETIVKEQPREAAKDAKEKVADDVEDEDEEDEEDEDFVSDFPIYSDTSNDHLVGGGRRRRRGWG